MRYQPAEDKDKELRKRMIELADKRKRFGVPRLHVLLRAEGLVINHKRTERIYKEEQLMLRKCKKKKRFFAIRKPQIVAKAENECWAMDFVHDMLNNGRKIRILSIIDTWDRRCPSLTARFSMTGQNVIKILEDACRDNGYPHSIQVDNGSEFTSKAFQKWSKDNGIELQFSRPGKPTDNGFIESFNGKLRDECLNENIFYSMQEVNEIIEKWRNDYNEERPHSALGWLTPAAYKQKNKQHQEINTDI